jgi:enoyl-CoA hydratase
MMESKDEEDLMLEFEYARYEVAEGGVAVITLDRPQAANAQNDKVLRELDECWIRAEEDPEVKVIVLRSTGKHFSSGHDMGPKAPEFLENIRNVEWLYNRETRGYLHYAKRWRDVPKPSIAAVQGKCVAAGLMLCWPCDLIVAADNAEFSDPVIFMGIGGGVEYQAHTWEFGARKAKELLFTGGSIDAAEAERIGMVNKVVPLDELESATMALARRIATQDSFALRLAKRSVNQTLDTMGFSAAIEHGFDLHHFGHARSLTIGDKPTTAGGIDDMKAKNAAASEKDAADRG